MKEAASLGMPNCGKSSLYHLLTGKRVPTGNRAGVTVESDAAPVIGSGERVFLTDLPGIRSCHPTSEDETVTLQYFNSHTPDLLIAVLDATDIDRQLPPICGLLRVAHAENLLVVLNFCDELERFPDEKQLTRALGTPVLAVYARTGHGVEGLLSAVRTLACQERSQAHGGHSAGEPPTGCFLCRKGGECETSLLRMSEFLPPVSRKKQNATRKMDGLLLRPAIGVPLFFTLMLLILWLTFGAPGEALTSGFCGCVLTPVSFLVRRLCQAAPEWLSLLLINGVLGGVGAVLSFLPRLLLLFLFQSLMEQSGFLSRMTHLFDPAFRRFGLRGDAVTPLMLGFGCSVPAILCTRAMKDCDARRRCASFLPAVACSARMPLCLLISDTFFPRAGWAVCALVWLFSGVCFLCFCALAAEWEHREVLPDQHSDPLPRWRIPDWRELIAAVWAQALHFLTRAGGMIFLFSLLIWMLSSFRFGTPGLVSPEESILSDIGRAISPVFLPAGFGDWRLTAALLAGIGAKEAALSTLGVLLGGEQLGASLLASGILTPASAVSFLIFYTLYFPCAATVSALRGKEKRFLWLPLVFAYLLAFAVFQIIRLL